MQPATLALPTLIAASYCGEHVRQAKDYDECHDSSGLMMISSEPLRNALAPL